ncbi:MAG: hypothetical protein ACFFDT_19040 [Candidatus Hodarchaeota archaeon]
MTIQKDSLIHQKLEEARDRIPLPPPDLLVRSVVPTYLKHLDKQWRGGWSWQWPLLIAGPKKGGKTLLVYQLIASCLLSWKPPWRVFYTDCKGDYQPKRIQQILVLRGRNGQRQKELDRVEKLTLHSAMDIQDLVEWFLRAIDLGLWVIDGWDQLMSEIPFTKSLEVLSGFNHTKHMGAILTMRGSVREILPQVPWDSVPFFLYITKLRPHGRQRLRIWQNGPRYKISDRILTFKYGVYVYQECECLERKVNSSMV